VEGVISYSVSIVNINSDQSKQTINGTLNIFLKGNTVKKDLLLGKGFNNTMMLNGDTKPTYSLRQIGNEKYAIEIDTTQLHKQQLKCPHLNLEPLISDIKTIANFRAEKVIVSCNNTQPIIIYYTKEWTINNKQLFEKFPSFTYLPLSFDINNEDGSVLHFELTKIEPKPLDSRLFTVPSDFKIISQEEYQSWQH
jgi:hypothetical protein